MRLFLAGAILSLFFSSCASPRAAVKRGYDFSSIQTVSVGNFTSDSSHKNSGPVVANEFIKQLIQSGYSVKTEDDGNVDAIILGNVSEYQPNRRYLLKVNQDISDGNIVISPRPIELGGSDIREYDPVFYSESGNKIIVSNATVGVSAYIKDKKTNEIIWSNNYSYEGLDLNSALESTVRYLIMSLPSKN